MDTELYCSFAKDCSADMNEQSIVYQLCHEFIKTSRALRYSLVHLKSLPVFIKEVFSLDSEEVLARFDTIALETLYYIAGWMIHAAKKAAPRRSINTRHCLMFLLIRPPLMIVIRMESMAYQQEKLID